MVWDGYEMVMSWFLCIFMFLSSIGCKTHCLMPLSTFVANMVPLEMKIAALETVEMVLRWSEMVWDGCEMVLRWFSCFLVQLGCKTHCLVSLGTFVANTVPPEMKIAALEIVEMVLRWFEMVLRWFEMVWDGYEMVFVYFHVFEFNWGAKHIVWCLWVLVWLIRYHLRWK